MHSPRLSHTAAAAVSSAMISKQKPSQSSSPAIVPDGIVRLLHALENDGTKLQSDVQAHADSIQSQPLEDEVPHRDLFREFEMTDRIQRLTGFTSNELRNLIQRSQPHWAKERGRGPQPLLSLADHWILLTCWLKSGCSISLMSAFLNLKPSTTSASLNRIRSVALATLKAEWWTHRKRPVPYSLNPSYKHIALLVDSCSFQINNPVGPFESCRSYFDGKQRIYALKKEISVLANPPHYAMFSSPAAVGSEHDYVLLKNGYHRYLSYLRKRPDERVGLPDDDNDCWAALFDNAYRGPSDDTNGLRRIVIPRKSSNGAEEVARTELSRIRVPVEQFFGRMWKLWSQARGPYQ